MVEKAKYEKINELFSDITEKCEEAVDKTLESCNLTPNDIKKVIMIGGSCQISNISNILKKKFGDKLVHGEGVGKQQAVAVGGAIEAFRVGNNVDFYEFINTRSEDTSVNKGEEQNKDEFVGVEFEMLNGLKVFYVDGSVEDSQTEESVKTTSSQEQTTDEIPKVEVSHPAQKTQMGVLGSIGINPAVLSSSPIYNKRSEQPSTPVAQPVPNRKFVLGHKQQVSPSVMDAKLIQKLDQCGTIVSKNVDKLREWSGLKKLDVLYDSGSDEKSASTFHNRITNHSHLYFILFDEKQNVFGHYLQAQIPRDNKGKKIYDKNIFMFSLFSNGRIEPRKFDINYDKKYMISFNSEDFYETDYFTIHKIGSKSCINSN